MPSVSTSVKGRSIRPLQGTVDPPPPSVGQLPITKGRHAGKKLCECPIDFIVWLASTSASPTYRDAARQFLGWGADEDVSDPPVTDPAPAAVRLPLIVWSWIEYMELVHGDDPVVRHGAQVLKALCSEVTGAPFAEEVEVARADR